MAIVALKSSRRSKPPAGTQLNPGHALVVGCRHFLPLNEGTGGRVANLADGSFVATSGTSWIAGTAGTAGTALRFSTGLISLTEPATPAGWTWAASLLVRSVPDYGMFFSMTDGLTNLYELRVLDDGRTQIIAGSGSVVDPVNLSLNVRVVIAATWDGSTLRLFKNGVQIGSGSLTVAPTGGPLAVGQRAGGSFGANMDLDWAYTADRGLSPTAIAQLSADPYAMFLAPTTRRFFAPSGVVGPVTVSPSGIASAEVSGTATLSAGAVALSPSGIASAGAFGVAILGATVAVSPSGIASAEAFGSATVARGPVTALPSGIASAEAFGSATLGTGAVTVSPSGIASAGAFGVPAVVVSGMLAPSGIGSAEVFGVATIVGGSTTVTTSGIPSAEAFGTATIAAAGASVLLTPSGVGSAEAFGTATLAISVGGPVTLSASGVASAEAFGRATLSGGVVPVMPPGISSASWLESFSPADDEDGLPADLASAIEAALSGDPALTSLAPGGVFYGVAKNGADFSKAPYVVFSPTGITPTFNSAMVGYYEAIDLRFNCYASQATIAEMMGKAILKARPTLTAMRLRDGYLMSFLFTGGDTIPATARGIDNTRVWNRTLTFRAKVGRRYP